VPAPVVAGPSRGRVALRPRQGHIACRSIEVPPCEGVTVSDKKKVAGNFLFFFREYRAEGRRGRFFVWLGLPVVAEVDEAAASRSHCLQVHRGAPRRDPRGECPPSRYPGRGGFVSSAPREGRALSAPRRANRIVAVACRVPRRGRGAAGLRSGVHDVSGWAVPLPPHSETGTCRLAGPNHLSCSAACGEKRGWIVCRSRPRKTKPRVGIPGLLSGRGGSARFSRDGGKLTRRPAGSRWVACTGPF